MSNTKDYEIKAGSTFQHVLRWEAPPFIYKPITAISQGAPCMITAPAHGVPNGWRVAVVSVKGMVQLNAKSSPPKDADHHKATVVDVDTLELNAVNSSEYAAYMSGGFIQYLTPVDLQGFSARMSVKENKKATTTFLTLTTDNGGIILDNVNKTITLYISATDTAALTWAKGVYDLEVVSATGVVTSLLEGKVSVALEVTN